MRSEGHARARGLAWGARALAGGAVVVGHAIALRDPEGVRGLALVLDHLFGLGLTLALLALCSGVGRLALRRVAVDIDSELERGVLATALGAAGVATALLLLGLLGALGAPGIVLTLATFAAWARRELVRLPESLRAAASELRQMGSAPALVVFAVVSAGLLVLSVGPPSDYDSLMYHVRIPAQFLDQGAVFVPEDNLHVAFVGLVHMLYLPLLAAGAPAACGILNACFAVLLGATVLMVGTRWFSRTVGSLALALLWASGIVPLTAPTPKVDVTLAFFLFLGHFALLRAAPGGDAARRWLALAGLLLGSAIGVKYLAIVYVAALMPAYALLWRPGVAPRGGHLGALTAMGAAVVLAATPWLVKNQVLLGSPLYPYFAERQLPSWVAALYDQRGLPSDAEPVGISPLRSVREPFDLVDWFLAPERMTPELEGRSYGANPAFLLLPFALWKIRDPRVAGVALPSLVFLVGLLLAKDRVNLRYLVPALPMLTVASAVAFDSLASRISRRRLRAAVVAAGVVGALGPAATGLSRKVQSTRALPHALGLESRWESLLAESNREVAGYARIAARVNAQVSREDRILLLFEGRGYRFEARVLQDNVLRNWPLLVPAVTPPNCLEGSDISHVLVGTGTLNYFEDRGIDLAGMQWGRFEEFGARCLEPVDVAPGMALYRVADRRAAPRRLSSQPGP